jgi:hypothetical protein
MAQGWYCFENGKERGPVSEQKIREALARGRLNDESYVRFGADGDWVLVRDSKFGSLASNPMAPPKPPAPETRGGTVGIWSRLKAGWTAAVQRPTPPTARSVQGAAIQLAKEKQIEAERAAREAKALAELAREDARRAATKASYRRAFLGCFGTVAILGILICAGTFSGAPRPNYAPPAAYTSPPAAPAVSSAPAPVPVDKPQPATASSPEREKTVHVRGYTKKDGTYVHPYDRAAPRRKKH